MNSMEITRRRLLQAGGLVMVSSLLPVSFDALSATPAPRPASPPPDRVDSFIALSADGKVTAFNGHVDLGTGVKTALSQIVADELDVDLAAVTMILGDTRRTPNQGRPSPAPPSRSPRYRCVRRRRRYANTCCSWRRGRSTCRKNSWPPSAAMCSSAPTARAV